MQREEDLLQQGVIKLNAKLLGTVLGLFCGFGLFLATNFLVLKGGPNVGAHLALLRQYFPGYSVTFLGSLIGFVYAFALGFVAGVILGHVYNKVARV